MKTSLLKSIVACLFGMTFFAETNAGTVTGNVMDKLHAVDSIAMPDKNLVIEREVTANGDTIYHYKYQAVDLGTIEDVAPTLYNKEEPRRAARNAAPAMQNASAQGNHYVGNIPFTEGVTPTGGKTYAVPIVTATCKGTAPQVSVAYNSQGGNGTAGYGWNVVGASAISVTGKTILYDGMTAGIDLSKPAECAFALDGVKLVRNTNALTQYDYETSQGFVLVKKHLAGSEIAYFTVAYPNGNTATFGFKNNTKTQYNYPITELVDKDGYKIIFEYMLSGNCHYLSRIAYGGKNEGEHTAEMLFNYEPRKDFTTVFLSGVALKADKLLKSVVSRNKQGNVFEELCTYQLTHELKDVSQLVQIDCSTGGVEMPPLRFIYANGYNNGAGLLQREAKLGLPTFSTGYGYKPLYIRGKFVKGHYGDGLITMPGHFSPYKVIQRTKLHGKHFAVICGSGYPADQDILIVPGLSFYNPMRKIKTEFGFQTIQAADVNGDGVDEIVKVNFGRYSKDNTLLRISAYTCSDPEMKPTVFEVALNGVAFDHEIAYSPLSRQYFFGDFLGTGKTQLLTISHNKTFMGDDATSWFSLIDINGKEKICETTLFSFGFDSNVFPLDVDGDGKMELCHNTSCGLDVYGFSFAQNRFVKMFDTPLKEASLPALTSYADINGDGKVDIILPPHLPSYTPGSSTIVPIWAPATCPYCGTETPVDFGSTDCSFCRKNLEIVFAQGGVCRICGTPLKSEVKGSHIEYSCPTHGVSDIVTKKGKYVDNGNKWTVYLSTGKDFERKEMAIVNHMKGDSYLFADVNNDGLADFLCSRGEKIRLFMNRNGVVSSVAQDSLTTTYITRLLALNACNPFNKSHVVTIDNGEVHCYSFTDNSVKANLLTSVYDSYGMRHDNRYCSMTETYSNYNTSATDYSYPYFDFLAPLYLLAENSLYDGKRSVHINNYHYEGAVAHRTGLGLIGFETVDVEDGIAHTISREHHDPKRLSVTTHIETHDKDVYMHYANTEFTSNKTCNPVLTGSIEANKLTGVWKETQFEYDAFNNPTRQCTSFDKFDESSLYFDKNNPYIEEVQTYRNIVTPERYQLGLPLTKTTTSGRNGSTWTTREEITYNAEWRPERQTTYINGNKTGETQWTYDAHGNMASEKSAPYNVTELLGNTYTYDASGRNLLTKTNALGQTTTFADYDKWGQPHRIIDHKGKATTIVTDAWGKPTSTTSPDGVTATTTTAWGGKELYTIAKSVTGQPDVIVHCDALGREVRKGNRRFDGKWQFVDNVYDVKGRLEKTSLPFKGDAPTLWNTYEYDNYDRPVKFTEASGKATTWSYAKLSVTETKEGIATTKTTDVSGALIKVEDPGGIITYTLRPDGQPSAITAPGNVTTTFEYDNFGRRTAIVDPSAGKQTLTEKYDKAGVYTSIATDARGKTVTTIKDKYGRTIQTNRPEFNVSYTYNKDGLLEREEYSDGRKRLYGYDAFGRIVHSSDKASAIDIDFTYSKGNIASVRYNSLFNPNGVEMTENYTYANGYKTEVTFHGRQSVWKLLAENDLGQPTQIATGPLMRTYSYNNTGLPTRQTAGKIQDISYRFDVQTGNLLSRTDNRRTITETFGYDKLNRLVQIGTQQVKYADNGNILQMPNMGVMGYENVAKPYQVTVFTPKGKNVPCREQQITYNSFQCPDKITENGHSASFVYDAEGDRSEMVVRKGDVEVLTRKYVDARYEIDNYFTERFYLGGDAYDALAVCVNDYGTDSIYYVVRDYLGNITHVVNEDGTLRQELSYDAWGRLRNPDTHQLYAVGEEPKLLLARGYTGHEYLPWFGLINMNARLYDPMLGRFLSPDPYVQMPDFTQNFNCYSYCLNNPLKYVDENGEFLHLVVGAAIGGFLNWATHGFKFNAKGLGYFAVGAVSGALGAGIGAGISSALAGGSFGAGFIGSSMAMTATSSFITGAAIGSGSGFSSGFVTSFGNGLIDGQNLVQSLWNGTKDAIIGAASGALLGGIEGGIYAAADGRNFWHGGRKTLDVSLPIPQVNQAGQYDCNYACAESVDNYYGNGRDQAKFLEIEPGNGKGLTDAQIGHMYGKAGYAPRQIPIKTNSPLSTVGDIANTMSANKAVVLNYNTGISGEINSMGQKNVYAHATVVTRVRMYDNGRFVINVMNPGGLTTRFTSTKRFHLIFGVY